jgi:hypothetical protein
LSVSGSVSVGGDLQAKDNAVVTATDGFFADDVQCRGDSVLSLRGGVVTGTIEAEDTTGTAACWIRLFGTSFLVNGAALEREVFPQPCCDIDLNSGAITGFLENGDPLAVLGTLFIRQPFARLTLVSLPAADTDGDTVVDPIDNCPSTSNVAQTDTDGDLIGDPCDPYPNDWNHCVAITNDCSDGIDNDEDGHVDFDGVGGFFPADPGCSGATDPTEKDASLKCDDGIENELSTDSTPYVDGLIDFPADPGCKDPWWTTEEPQCQNGIDDPDPEDTKIDWDGGASAGNPAPGTKDPQCNSSWKNNEKKLTGCGLGFELALVLPSLAWLHARRRRRAGAPR